MKVLDLACGTGNYLKKQIEEHKGYSISWLGIDKSPEMLEQARRKDIRATLMIGEACELPVDEESVDYVKVRFAFHHFADKKKSVSELKHVLTHRGTVSMVDFSHDYMKFPWMYRYFPSESQSTGKDFHLQLKSINGFLNMGLTRRAWKR